jgi:hypothetical protein
MAFMKGLLKSSIVISGSPSGKDSTGSGSLNDSIKAISSGVGGLGGGG